MLKGFFLRRQTCVWQGVCELLCLPSSTCLTFRDFPDAPSALRITASVGQATMRLKHHSTWRVSAWKIILLWPRVAIMIVLLRPNKHRRRCRRDLTSLGFSIDVSAEVAATATEVNSPKDKVKKVEKKGEWIEKGDERESAREERLSW